MGQKRQWYYRGSLKSCNYSCSYCPFCKKTGSLREAETDRKRLFQFIERLEKMKDMAGAVQIVPYGEALIHTYYWEGLARLSCHKGIDAVGAQSNFSFPVENMLNHYIQHGGKIEKLRLWGTFHPEMTSVETFVSQCRKLSKWKISFSAGAVGVPSQIPHIQKLRKTLPSSVYLWINKMDGLGRNYTEEEIEKFLEIDLFFELEMNHYLADKDLCGNQLFVESDGSLRRCNLCRAEGINLYDTISAPEGNPAGEFSTKEKKLENIISAPEGNPAGEFFTKENKIENAISTPELAAEFSTASSKLEDVIRKPLSCTRRECSCYLAYNNRLESEMMFFYPYPAFRIPVYPKAIFLDIDGTIIPKGQKRLSEKMKGRILKLAEHSSVYLATSLPMEEALRRVQGIGNALAGGVFASGGRCVIFQNKSDRKSYDTIAPLETNWLKEAEKKQKDYGVRLHTYQKDGQIYKVTLTFPVRKFSNMEEKERFFEALVKALSIPKSCRYFLEDHCIEIIRSDRGKLEGILEIMQEIGYQKKDVMAFGNGKEDEAMLAYFQRKKYM